MKYDSLFSRLVANTHEPISDTACWIWKGQVGTNRRPQISRWKNGKHCTCNAAREMLDIFYVMDSDAETSHMCSESWLCINPDHLIPETKAQNMARRWGKPLPPGRVWVERADSPIAFNFGDIGDEHRLLLPTGQQTPSSGGRRADMDHEQRAGLVHPAVRLELPALGGSLGAVGSARDGASNDCDDRAAACARPHRSGESSQRLRLNGAVELACRPLEGQRLEGQPMEPRSIGAV